METNKTKLSKKEKLFVVFGMTIILLFGLLTTILVKNNAEKDTKEMFLVYTNIFNTAINPSRIETLTNTESDLENPDYTRISEQLVGIYNASKSSGIRWMYTMFVKDGNVVFGPDSISKGEYGHSEPGDIYESITPETSQIIKDLLVSGDFNILGPDTDEWGTWLSILVPIKDSRTGIILGILGTDVDYNYYKSIILQSLILPVVSTILILILFIIVFVYVFRINGMSLVLKESEAKYRLIFDQAPIGIYTINQDGVIDSFNPKMVDISGPKSAIEVLGLNVFSLDSYKKVGLDKFFRAGLNGKYFTITVEYVSQIGKKKTWRHYRGVPIFSPDSEIVDRLLLLVEDITKKKELEEQDIKHLEGIDRMNKFMVNRELRMIELKKEIKDLKEKK